MSKCPTDGSVWGGGHTRETDPTLQGWRVRHAWYTADEKLNVLLIGRPNVAGCATVVLHGGLDDGHPNGCGHWVKVFDTTPQAVMATKDSLDAWLALIAEHEIWDKTICPAPGYGLLVLQMIRQWMADCQAQA